MQGNTAPIGAGPSRRFATRLALALATAALVPLVAFGTWAFLSLQQETKRAAIEATMALAEREAGDMRRELERETTILSALADDLLAATSSPERQLGILDNYTMRFPSLRGITVFAPSGEVVVQSPQGGPSLPAVRTNLLEDTGVALSPVALGQNQTASAVFSLPLGDTSRPFGWVAAEVTLDSLQELVDNLHLGPEGQARLLDVDGRVIAGGAQAQGTRPAGAVSLSGHPLFGASERSWRQLLDDRGVEQLAIATRVEPAGWLLLLEQPTSEAFAPARRLGVQLTIAACGAVLLMLAAGIVLGRRAIAPVHALDRATQSLAGGDFGARVQVTGHDEFARLGRSFNLMADRLVTLQNEVARQERQIVFGRVVAGLFHDLSQPVQTIGNSARMLLRPKLDDESRASVRQTLERELETLRRFMDDMLNVARPVPIDRTPLDVNTTVAHVVDAMRPDAERARVALVAHCVPNLLCIEADHFALGRVFRNLIANALQATAPGGRVSITTRRVADHVEVDVTDTGTGIAPARLATLFEEFATTKRRGLGLGLATSRRLVEQLGGTIAVTSELEAGTTFTLRFPVTDRPASLAEAAS